MMETIVVGVTDRFPDSVGKHRVKFVFFCCVVGFLFGIPLTTKVHFKSYLSSYAYTLHISQRHHQLTRYKQNIYETYCFINYFTVGN